MMKMEVRTSFDSAHVCVCVRCVIQFEVQGHGQDKTCRK